MNKIILAIFSLAILSFFACENEYDAGEIASMSDARIILTLIDARDVPYEGQRSFYDHTAKVVTVQVLTLFRHHFQLVGRCKMRDHFQFVHYFHP